MSGCFSRLLQFALSEWQLKSIIRILISDTKRFYYIYIYIAGISLWSWRRREWTWFYLPYVLSAKLQCQFNLLYKAHSVRKQGLCFKNHTHRSGFGSESSSIFNPTTKDTWIYWKFSLSIMIQYNTLLRGETKILETFF